MGSWWPSGTVFPPLPAPVILDSLSPHRRQAALAVPAVLVAEYARLAQAIVAQSVRTKQPIAILVDCADRLLVRYRRPYQAVHVFYRLDFRFDDTHLTFTITPVSLSLCLSTFTTQ